MDYLFLGFVILLGLAGLGFLVFFSYRLDRTPEIGSRLRRFNRGLLALTLLALVVGLGLAMAGSAPLSDWGLVLALGMLALTMLVLAAQGFGIGFQQQEQDGVGFIRFFQLGSAIILCLALVPAFIAFITFAARLR